MSRLSCKTFSNARGATISTAYLAAGAAFTDTQAHQTTTASAAQMRRQWRSRAPSALHLNQLVGIDRNMQWCATHRLDAGLRPRVLAIVQSRAAHATRDAR